MRYKTALLIVNPYSRRFRGNILENIVSDIKKYDINLTLKLIGEVDAYALSAYDLVLVNGGDASMNFTANLLINKPIPILILPSGTSDVYAIETGISRNPCLALKLIETGVERRITMGKANDRYFVQMAGIGFDALAIRTVNESLKQITGKFAYLVSALKHLNSWDDKIIFTVDGERIEGYTAIIGNGKRYGGRFSATPDANLFSETVDIVIFTEKPIYRYFLSILLSKESKYAIYRKAKRITAEQEGIDIQIDGDWIGKTPVEIIPFPESLTVLVPR